MDAARSGTSGYIAWGDDEGFLWGRGCGRMKNPNDAILEGMIGVAAVLDAWVMGDDGERYFPGPVSRQAVPTRLICSITRSRGGRYAPIPEDDWAAVVAAQPDFLLLDEIEADLESGRRTIPAPPTPHWTG